MLLLTIVLPVRNLRKERCRVAAGLAEAALPEVPWQTMLSQQVLSVIQHRMPVIPPLAALRAFEATARLGGFARAAAALNVSTSAVSHQIRGLEENLGVRLLERSTGVGGVRVTPAGARLLAAASGALGLLEDACAEIRGTSQLLTVSANVSLSTMWLARRLAEFSALHPETPVNAIIQMEEPDFLRYGINLAVVHVPERALRPGDVVLLREEVFPVCSPELAPVASEVLGRCRLLQEAHEDSPELDWRSWASTLGLPRDFAARIVQYSTFGEAIGAALGGAGVALGRSPLIDPELGSGRLVRLVPGQARPASWRFVLRRGPSRQHRMLGALIDFLRAEATAAAPATARPDAGAAKEAGSRMPMQSANPMSTAVEVLPAPSAIQAARARSGGLWRTCWLGPKWFGPVVESHLVERPTRKRPS